MDMPGYLDYGKMAMQDPMAYGQSMDQLKLAQLFQAEKQKQAESKSLADMMANDQSQKMNPLLVEQQQQTNAGKGIANEEAGMTLGIRKATYPQEMQDKIEKYALGADDNKLKMVEQKINLAYMSGDPAQIEKAKHAEQFLSAVRAEKRKNDAAMDKERYSQQQETGRAVERNNTTLEAARIGAQARIDSAGKRGGSSPADFWSTYYGKLKTVADKHAALISEATKLGADDPEAQKMIQMAEAIRPQVEAANAAKAGTLNVGAATNMPVNQVPSVAPPGAQPQVPKMQAPPSALQYLQQHPEMKDAFKAKYGYLP